MTTNLAAIGDRLRTQDNRITQNPMFCVQILRRDVGYDAHYACNYCWVDSEAEEQVFEEPADSDDDRWEKFGYVDRWETVMVAFTEGGCQEYLALDGHNCRSRAHDGQVRIYVESFNRCPEMIAIREMLMEGQP